MTDQSPNSHRFCARCRKAYAVTPLAVSEKSFAPFCSKRCADIDMMHWLKGDYIISETGDLGLTDEAADALPRTRVIDEGE